MTGAQVEAAANAIRDCMLNDGWRPWGTTEEKLTQYLRNAARAALEAAAAFAPHKREP